MNSNHIGRYRIANQVALLLGLCSVLFAFSGCKQDFEALTPSGSSELGSSPSGSSTVRITSTYPTGSLTLSAASPAQTFIVAATSPFGYTLSYIWSLSSLGGVSTVLETNTTGTINFDPSLYAADTYTLTVKATDRRSSAEHSWSIKINRAPTITGTVPTTSTKKLTATTTLPLSATVSDLDGDALTASWTLNGVASGFLVDGGILAGTASATLTADTSLVGSNNVVLSVTDGNLTTTYTWTVQVNYFHSGCNNLTQGDICTYVGFAGVGSGVGPTHSTVVSTRIVEMDFDSATKMTYFLEDANSGVIIRAWNRDTVAHNAGGVSVAAGTVRVIAGTGHYTGGGSTNLTQHMGSYAPSALTVDPLTGDLYSAGYYDGEIRLIQAGSTTYTAVVPGVTVRGLRYHNGRIYFSDDGGPRIAYYDIMAATVTTVAGNNGAGHAGDGNPATNAAVTLTAPGSIDFDSNDNMFFTDDTRCTIRVVCANPITGGVCSTGKIDGANALHIDPAFAGAAPQAGYIYTMAGTNGTCSIGGALGADGDPLTTKLEIASKIDILANGNILVGGGSPSRIRLINVTGAGVSLGNVTVPAYSIGTLANTNGASAMSSDGIVAQYNSIGYGYTLARLDPLTGHIDYADTGVDYYWHYEGRLRQIHSATGVVSTLFGSGFYSGSAQAGTHAANSMGVSTVHGMLPLSDGSLLFSEGSYLGNIRKVDPYGQVTTINRGYSGPPASASSIAGVSFADPRMWGDSSGNVVIVDRYYQAVYYWNRSAAPVAKFGQTIAAGAIAHVAGVVGVAGYNGNGSPATSYQLNYPLHAVTDGTNLYIADTANECIRKVDNTGAISTLVSAAGGCGNVGNGPDDQVGTNTGVSGVNALSVDSSGNLFIADSGNNYIRAMNTQGGPITIYGQLIAAGNVKIIAGGGVDPSTDGIAATTAELYNPNGIAFDATGDLYFSQYMYSLVRKIVRTGGSAGNVSTVAGKCVAGYCYGRMQWDETEEGIPATSSYLHNPAQLVFDANGDLFIGTNWNWIKKVKLSP